jgi:anti-sigma-K factor RskA
MTQNESPMREDDVVAAEYVIGVLPVSERNAFKTRLAGSAELRGLVHAWEEHFISLTHEIKAVEAPRHVLQKIEDRIFARPKVSQGWLQSLAVWRGLSFASLAALVVAGGLYYNQIKALPNAGTNFVAELSAPNDAIRLVAFYDDQKGQIKLNRVAGSAAAGRVFQLWLIEGKNPPVSLGVLPDDATGTLTFAAELKPKLAGAVLAISDEPTGGSLTGQPTGAVLATGQVHAI